MTVKSFPFRRKLAFTLCILVPLCFVAGCAASNSTRATGSWQEPQTKNGPFVKVLVVAVAGDPDMRRDLEEQIARDINGAGGVATSSLAIEANQPHPPKTPENLTALVKQVGADAVLVLRGAGETVGEGETKDQAYVDIGPQLTIEAAPDMTAVWASDYSIKQTGSQLIAKTDTKLAALLYDVADNNRAVYRVAIEAKYADEGGSDPEWVISGRVANAITGKLRSAGLIR